MKAITKITTLIMAAGMLTLVSCQKEKPIVPSTSNNLETSALGASQEAINSMQPSSNAYKQNQSSCAVITNDTTVKPHVYTIDYGSGCTNSNGVFQSGKMTVTYDDMDARKANNKFNITFQNFVTGSEQIAGTISLKNNGANSSGNLNYTITVNIQSTQGGTTYPLSGTLGYEWIAGQSTPTTSDDQFSLTGNLSGATGKHPNAMSANITSPLISSVACNNQYIQGTIAYSQAGQPTRTFDYGNGTCTGNVTISSSGGVTTKPQGGNALALKL